MNEKYIELAKKLKALADRGVDGEKFNAIRQLEKLMAKHDFTLEDLQNEEKHFNPIRIKKNGKNLLLQICSMVIDGSIRKAYENKGVLYAETTHSELIEIEAKYNFYYHIFQKELEIFYEAFIYKNNLYPEHGSCKNVNDFTEEELKKYMKIRIMANSIDKSIYHKQLQKGN